VYCRFFTGDIRIMQGYEDLKGKRGIYPLFGYTLNENAFG